MKRIIALVLVSLLLHSASALAVDARSATETARALAPEGWVYLYTEKDGKTYEVHFLNELTNEEMEISVSANEDTPVKIETENDWARGSTVNALSEEDVRNAVLSEYPEAEIDSFFAVKDDGLFEIQVYFTLADRIGLLKLNAETGEVIKRKIILTAPYDGWQTQLSDDYVENAVVSENKSPDKKENKSENRSEGKNDSKNDSKNGNNASSSFISVSQAKSAVTSRHPGAKITEIELDFDDGKYVYEGEAYLNGREYDFEVDAATGSLVKWKLDD